MIGYEPDWQLFQPTILKDYFLQARDGADNFQKLFSHEPVLRKNEHLQVGNLRESRARGYNY